jgi:hypothetical protein
MYVELLAGPEQANKTSSRHALERYKIKWLKRIKINDILWFLGRLPAVPKRRGAQVKFKDSYSDIFISQ